MNLKYVKGHPLYNTHITTNGTTLELNQWVVKIFKDENTDNNTNKGKFGFYQLPGKSITFICFLITSSSLAKGLKSTLLL